MSDEVTTVRLDADHEWRFDVAFEYKLVVRLTDGAAELFGTELARGREYEFTGQRAAIFTYHGCTLEWSGWAESHTVENPVMKRYANVHFALENLRRSSERRERAAQMSDRIDDAPLPQEHGPVTLIAGPFGKGKSTLAKILVSYATKMGRFPMLVNMDSTFPVLSPPGGLVAVPISHILDIEDGCFGQPSINGPAQTHHKQPIVINYGLATAAQSPAFYASVTARLAEEIAKRQEQDARVRHSGVIIDTPGDADIAALVAAFGVTVVLVVDDEGKAVEIRHALGSAAEGTAIDTTNGSTNSTATKPDCAVLNIPTSTGVTSFDDAYLRRIQRRAISEYFFGSSRQALSPFTVSTPLKELTVWRPVEANESGDSLLTRVEPSAVLQNCVLAVVNAAPDASPEDVARAETLGFVQVAEADDTKPLARILLPVPGGVPKKALIMGEYRYHE